VLHLDLDPPAHSETSSPTRRDTRTHHRPAASQYSAYDHRFSLACPLRARSHGHQRSITVNPVICHQVAAGQDFPGQDYDPSPIFQAGVHACSPSAELLVGREAGIVESLVAYAPASSSLVPMLFEMNALGSWFASWCMACQPVQCAGRTTSGASAASPSTVGPMIGSNTLPVR
jgi:hypothetical protein